MRECCTRRVNVPKFFQKYLAKCFGGQLQKRMRRGDDDEPMGKVGILFVRAYQVFPAVDVIFLGGEDRTNCWTTASAGLMRQNLS